MQKILKRHGGFICLLFVIFIIELYLAKTQGFWIDEIFSWNIIIQPASQIINPGTDVIGRWYQISAPPFYELIMKLYFSLVGYDVNELVARMPTIIFFLLFMAFVYYFAVRLSEKPLIGLYALFFILLFPGYVNYGHYMREYSFVFLGSIISFILIYHINETGFKLKYLILLSIIYTILLYSSYLTAIIILGQIIFLRIIIEKEKKQIYLTKFWQWCVLLPWGLFLYWVPRLVYDTFWEMTYRNKGASSLAIIMLERFKNLILAIIQNKILFFHYILFFLFFFIINVKSINRFKNSQKRFYYLVYCIFLVYSLAILLFSGSGLDINSGYFRYSLFIFYMVCIINAVALSYLPKLINLLCILFLVSSVNLTDYKGNNSVKNLITIFKSIDFSSTKDLILYEDTVAVPEFVYYFLSPSKTKLVAKKEGLGIFEDFNNLLKNQYKIESIIANIYEYPKFSYSYLQEFQRIFVFDVSYFCRDYDLLGYTPDFPLTTATNYISFIESLFYRYKTPILNKNIISFPGYSLAIYTLKE